jgi:monoamine oxidase
MPPDLRRRHLLLLLAASGLSATGLTGRALAQQSRPSRTTTGPVEAGRGEGLKVIVVGAGMAGLTAASALAWEGAEVTVLEARDRIGGRIFTDRSLGVPVEHGANFIHGVTDNPVAALAEEAGLTPILVDGEQWQVFERGGTEPKDFEIEDVFDDLERIGEKMVEEADGDATLSLEDVIDILDPAMLKEPIGNWALTDAYESEFGAPLSEISAVHFDAGEVLDGSDAVIKEGYDSLAAYLADGLDLRLNEVVKLVRHTAAGVTVETDKGRLTADHCIVTVPLGVLKAGAITFDPPLPEAQRKAVAALGFGRLAKVSVVFDKAFWPEEPHFLGYADATRGRFADMLNLVPLQNAPVLTMVASGDYADKVDAMDERTVKADVMAVLRDIFGAKVPEPRAIARHVWSLDPFARGAYSFIALGAEPDDYAALANAASPRLHLAGEHTSADYYGTVHGALTSGERVAERLLSGHAR